MPVNVISGKNCIKNNREIFKRFGKKCLIITGKHSAEKCGALGDVTAALDADEIEYEIFGTIATNPLLSQCEAAGYKCAKNKCEFIVAIGGGSPLDAAKAAAIFAATQTFETATDIYNKDFNSPAIPLIVVGTTAGTGSEVSAGAVITVDSTGRKASIVNDECYAKVAFCDPQYTYNIPKDITVSTALDAFAHATEGWFSRKQNMACEAFAAESLPIIWKTLKALSDGKELTESERDDIYYASVCAGMVLSQGTLYPHGLGYVLTENFGVPHGQACAVFDRHLILFSERYAPTALTQKYFSLLDAADGAEVCRTLDKLIDIPDSVKFSDEEIKNISCRWNGEVAKFKNAYGKFTKLTAVNLMKEYFGE